GKCPLLPKSRWELKRRHCRVCRFRRCVEAGMNPMGIVVEEDALEQSLQRHSLFLNDRVMIVDELVNRLVDNLAYLDFKLEQLRKSDLNPHPSDPQSIIDVLKRHSAMGQPQQEMTGWPLKQGTTRAVMSLEEHAQLRIPLQRLSTDGLPPSFKFWFYADLVFAVEWAKALDFFRLLDLADQRALICFSAMQILNLTHSYFSYSNGSDKTVFPDGIFSIWSPRGAGRDVINPFLQLKIDKTEYLILKSLVICNPSCDPLSDRARAILQKERKTLTRVLLNYCLKRHGPARGAARFGEIIAIEGILLNQAMKTKQLSSLLSVLNLRPMRIHLMD
ncbi:hypothetical protein PMAYCL1PPCAC_31598, partial [Pristionchus mayeri]